MAKNLFSLQILICPLSDFLTVLGGVKGGGGGLHLTLFRFKHKPGPIVLPC